VALRRIVLYPDPVLLHPTSRVEQVDQSVRELVRDMAETMNHAPGIGLAANQVGVGLRICVVDLSSGSEAGALKVLINPTVLATEGRQVGEEGCLSFPDITIEVERALRATVESTDLEGRKHTDEFEGLMARAVLHECEHLDGQTFLQNLSPLKRELVRKRIKKRIKAGDWVETAPQ
jgi:peptide deformylase